MRWKDRIRTRLQFLFARKRTESRIAEEFQTHIEMETQRLVGAGLDPQEARRRALVSFGSMEAHREALREGRGLACLAGISLDLKLGLRMLVKYPGLSIVGVLGMGVAVAISAISFGVIQTVVQPSLPLDEGDRIVAIQNIDARSSKKAPRTHLHDFLFFRRNLRTVQDLGAYRIIERNLIPVHGRAEPVQIVEMSAAGFQVARVPPLQGRFLQAEDEREGATPVVVIGYDVWRNQFAGDPAIMGQTLQLGATSHTIVGVMPEDFAFPINNRLWTPLRLNPTQFERGRAPAVSIFGRLAPNVALAEAEAELQTVGQRISVDHPGTHEFIHPRVVHYPHAFLEGPETAWTLQFVPLLVSILLVAIATNVSILVYARTSTRMSEIALRSALGASRGRVVAQIAIEALVLSAAAALMGLVTAIWALKRIEAFLSQTAQLPFWMGFGISPAMILYVAGLAALGTVVAGVIPALRATRRQAGLQQLALGRSGAPLGRTWTFLIVAQVAVSTAILPFAITGLDLWVRYSLNGPGFPAKEYVTARLHLDREAGDRLGSDRMPDRSATPDANLQAEFIRCLAAEPGIEEAVLASELPSHDFEHAVRIEVEPAPGNKDQVAASTPSRRRVDVSWIDLGYFSAFGVPLLAGQAFQAADASPTSTSVIVNLSFVREYLGSGDALGRRVSLAPKPAASSAPSLPGPWLEIVGVVPDFPRAVRPAVVEPRLYHAMVPGTTYPVYVILRTKSALGGITAGRLRELAVSIDPLLRLQDVGTLEASLSQDAADRVLILLVAVVTLSVLLLSAAGIYALTSYTISMRRREIGIRSALGASWVAVIRSVLSRTAIQVSAGIALGTTLMGLVAQSLNREGMDARGVALLLTAAAVMIGIALFAAIAPARRALRIPPTEALRGE